MPEKRCDYCEWRCDLGDGKLGVCQMYVATQGEIRERFPNRWSTYAVSRIESMPFYHVKPGSRTMTVGTVGCNFRCRYCSNGYIARCDPDSMVEGMFHLLPEDMVRLAKKLGCRTIVFNVNEPTVSLPTLQALKEHAQPAGISLGCLTNAYNTETSVEILASIFDFFNIGLKGFSLKFHREYIGIGDVTPIFRNIRRLAATHHVEVTTPIIQGVNDHEMDDIAHFLSEVDPTIPWHVFRLLPEHEMKDAHYPNIMAIEEILRPIRERLVWVYFHNFVGSDWVDSHCPQCGKAVIERISLGCGGDRLSHFHCIDNRCPECGCAIKIWGTSFPTEKEERS